MSEQKCLQKFFQINDLMVVLSALCLAFVLMLGCSPSFSQSEVVEPNGDWSLSLTATKVPRFMNHKGSSLDPVVQVRVQFRKRDQKTRHWTPLTDYEDFWYHDNAPLGCRRYFDLENIAGLSGDIRIELSDEAHEHTRPLMNAAIRTMLDACVRDAMLSCITIPLDLYEDCVSEFDHFCFYESHSMNARNTAVTVRIVSTPPRIKRYYEYRLKTAN